MNPNYTDIFGRLNHNEKKIKSVNVSVNNLKAQDTGKATIPFEWYPDASIVSTGVKYQYTDGAKLYGYKILGMVALEGDYTYINEYLGTLVITNTTMAGLFPGKLEGMLMSYVNADGTYITSSLGQASFYDNNHGEFVSITGMKVSFEPYTYNGEQAYAIVIVSDDCGTSISGVINYEIEFSYPSDFNNTKFELVQD